MTTRALTPVLQPAEVVALVRGQTNGRLLDVGTPGEHETVHMSGAYILPLDTLGEHARQIRVDVADPVILVCQPGRRAPRTEEALTAAGLGNLPVLDGGVLPHNRPASCAAPAMVRALSDRRVPAAITRGPITFAASPRSCAS